MKHNWEYKPIGDCFAYIKNGANIKQEKEAGGLPVTRIETLSNGVFNRSKMGYANIFEIGKYEPNVLNNGDLLMSHINSKTYVGRTVIYESLPNEVIIHGMNLLRLIPNDAVRSKFFYYTTLSHYFKSKIVNIRKDSVNQSSFSISDLKKISIPVPPMETQEQIVAELDQINDLIAKNRELLSQLDSLAQSLFYDTFGDPITNPKGFPIKTLKDVCILKSGDSSANRLPDGKVPYVKVGDMNLLENKQGILTSSKFVNIGNKTKLLFPIGTTIFPKRGGAILTNKKRLTKVQICCDLNIMGAIPQNIHPLYLYFFFLEKDFSELVDGSTVPQINNTDIYLLKIQVPPLALQEEFASKVEAIEAQKVKVDAEISELQNLLDARMDYWFN